MIAWLRRLLFGTPRAELEARCQHVRVLIVHILKRRPEGMVKSDSILKCADCGREVGQPWAGLIIKDTTSNRDSQ